MAHKRTYKAFKPNASYDILVRELCNKGHYRIHVYEEHDAHIVEIVDLWLTKYQDRRYLEAYANSINNPRGVFFGGMVGNCYKLDHYIEQNKSFKGYDFLQDIHVN